MAHHQEGGVISLTMVHVEVHWLVSEGRGPMDFDLERTAEGQSRRHTGGSRAHRSAPL